MFYVYIIYSTALDQFYVGQTENLDNRIFRHTNSESKSTKKANDWVLMYHESFETRSEAIKRENQNILTPLLAQPGRAPMHREGHPALAGYSPQALNPERGFAFYMFYVYIIYSTALDQFYVGQTENLDNRIFRHTNSGSKSTKKANDWVLMYHESFETRSEAIKRENQIKKIKSRKYIGTLTTYFRTIHPDASGRSSRFGGIFSTL